MSYSGFNTGSRQLWLWYLLKYTDFLHKYRLNIHSHENSLIFWLHTVIKIWSVNSTFFKIINISYPILRVVCSYRYSGSLQLIWVNLECVWRHLKDLYPESPHRQSVDLAYPRTRVRAPVASASRAIWLIFTQCNTWSSGGTALYRVGVTASQLYLPSLTPSSVASCGRLQLGAPHWATSVAFLQVVDNWPHILSS